MTQEEFERLTFGKGDNVVFTLINVDDPKGETTYTKEVLGVDFENGVYVEQTRNPNNNNVKQFVHYKKIQKYIQGNT